MASGASNTCSPTCAPTVSQSVRRLGKPEPTYRKITFHKEHLDEDQHLDAVLLGPGHPLYAAVDERLNEKLAAAHRRHGRLFVDAASRDALPPPLL